MPRRRTFMLIATVAVLLAAVVYVAANRGRTPETTTAPSSSSNVARDADPALARPPRPGAVIVRQWRYLKGGAVPVAILAYSSRVRERVGITKLAGAAASLQEQLEGYTLSVVKEETTGAGHLVTVEAVNPKISTEVARYSYLMRRRGGRWVITYDSLMHAALAGYVQTRVQNMTAPDGKPTRAALMAAAAATEAFREAELKNAASTGAQTESR